MADSVPQPLDSSSPSTTDAKMISTALRRTLTMVGRSFLGAFSAALEAGAIGSVAPPDAVAAPAFAAAVGSPPSTTVSASTAAAVVSSAHVSFFVMPYTPSLTSMARSNEPSKVRFTFTLQAITHSPQPLHKSLFTDGCPASSKVNASN